MIIPGHPNDHPGHPNDHPQHHHPDDHPQHDYLPTDHHQHHHHQHLLTNQRPPCRHLACLYLGRNQPAFTRFCEYKRYCQLVDFLFEKHTNKRLDYFIFLFNLLLSNLFIFYYIIIYHYISFILICFYLYQMLRSDLNQQHLNTIKLIIFLFKKIS